MAHHGRKGRQVMELSIEYGMVGVSPLSLGEALHDGCREGGHHQIPESGNKYPHQIHGYRREIRPLHLTDD